MWCPKCKNEYVAGITACVDCGCELVEDLEAFEKQEAAKNLEAFQDRMDFTISENEASNDNADAFTDDAVSDDSDVKNAETEKTQPMRAYVSKKAKKEDMKSTAYTFTLVGAIGLIVLVLSELNVLPFSIPTHMRLMLGVVLGAMFLIFFIIGLRYFKLFKDMGNADVEEQEQFKTITTWFTTCYSANAIDEDIPSDLSEEQLYFSRYDFMSKAILVEYPDLDEAFLDHIIESLYTEIFKE